MTKYTKDQVAENRRIWVEALRSGDYRQTRQQLAGLRSDEKTVGYCCLGVAEKCMEITELHTDCDAYFLYEDEYGVKVAENSVLTNLTAEALGLAVTSPEALWHDRVVGLTRLNDEYGFSLAEIAEVIVAQSPDWDGKCDPDVPSWTPDDEDNEPPRPVV